MKVVKTIIADDHPVFLEGIKCVLQRSTEPKFEVIASLRSGRKLLEYPTLEESQLIILDLNLDGMDGLDVIKHLHQMAIPAPILVFSRYQDTKIVKAAIQSGANGFILKSGDVFELYDAINVLLNRKTYLGKGLQFVNGNHSTGSSNGRLNFEEKFVRKYHLTKREIQILRLITNALSNKEIAKELFISDQTVSVHRKNIMRKLGVSNTAGLIKTAYEYCIV